MASQHTDIQREMEAIPGLGAMQAYYRLQARGVALARMEVERRQRADDTRRIRELDRLIETAQRWKSQIERYPAVMDRNPYIQLDFAQAGSAIADDWTDWASELDHQLNGDG